MTMRITREEALQGARRLLGTGPSSSGAKGGGGATGARSMGTTGARSGGGLGGSRAGGGLGRRVAPSGGDIGARRPGYWGTSYTYYEVDDVESCETSGDFRTSGSPDTFSRLHGDCASVERIADAVEGNACPNTALITRAPANETLHQVAGGKGVTLYASGTPRELVCLQELVNGAAARHVQEEVAIWAGIFGAIPGSLAIATVCGALGSCWSQAPSNKALRAAVGGLMGAFYGAATGAFEGALGAALVDNIHPYAGFDGMNGLIEGAIGGGVMGLVGGVMGAFADELDGPKEPGIGAAAAGSFLATWAGGPVGARIHGTFSSTPHDPRTAFGAQAAGAGFITLMGAGAALLGWGTVKGAQRVVKAYTSATERRAAQREAERATPEGIARTGAARAGRQPSRESG